MKLRQYKDLVDRLARERSGETVLNGSAEHAAVINERMFTYAESTMDILSRRFDPRIYGTEELIEAARLFSGSPERKTRIALEQADAAEFVNHPFAKEFLDNDNIQVRQIPAPWHDAIEVNFTVMDGDSYRFEKDKKEAVAIAAFGDKEGIAHRLSNYFESVWAGSSPISVKTMLKDAV